MPFQPVKLLGRLATPVIAITLATATLAATASPASAGLIDAQFFGAAPQTGAAVIGSSGDVWNSIAPGTAGSGTGSPSGTAALLDSTGAASGLTLSYSSVYGYTATSNFTQFTGTPYANLMQGVLITPLNLTISGLAAGQAFSLFAYTQGDNNSFGRNATLTVNGVSQTTNQSNSSLFIAGDNYVVFTGLANSLGQIIVDGSSTKEGDFNGFQLFTADLATAVPEPATLALLGAGLVVAGVRARRRSV